MVATGRIIILLSTKAVITSNFTITAECLAFASKEVVSIVSMVLLKYY